MFKPLDCKDMGIGKFIFVAKTHFLTFQKPKLKTSAFLIYNLHVQGQVKSKVKTLRHFTNDPDLKTDAYFYSSLDLCEPSNSTWFEMVKYKKLTIKSTFSNDSSMLLFMRKSIDEQLV